MQFVDKPTKKVSRGTNSMTYIMLHHTGDANNVPDENVVNYVVSHPAKISYHYLVGKDGVIYKIANDSAITWHAGVGKWGNIQNTMNFHSIGVSVISNGKDFTDKQRNATKLLTEYLMSLYNISVDKVIRHADYASDRGRRDLGPNFFIDTFDAWKLSLNTPHNITKIERASAQNTIRSNSSLWHATKRQEVKDRLHIMNEFLRKIYK